MSVVNPYRVAALGSGSLGTVCSHCEAELPDGVAVDWVEGGTGELLGVVAYRMGSVPATPDYPNGRDEVVHDCSEMTQPGAELDPVRLGAVGDGNG